jgi:hypothetical protein
METPMKTALPAGCLTSLMLAWAMALMPSVARADQAGAAIKPSDAPPAFKFTTGFYRVSGGGAGDSSGPGLDLNLRYERGDTHAWVGWFRSPALEYAQPRAGFDTVVRAGSLRVLTGLEAASGGFLGTHVDLETGTTWFGGVGLGRTNLRNYANLNFDPNDSVVVYAGHRWEDDDSISAQLIRDNRQNPGQQNLHLLWRNDLGARRRTSWDLLQKQGNIDGQFIRRYGLTATYEQGDWFVRAAYDPKVNFTRQNMMRLSVGMYL